jgi:hypothetical protein
MNYEWRSTGRELLPEEKFLVSYAIAADKSLEETVGILSKVGLHENIKDVSDELERARKGIDVETIDLHAYCLQNGLDIVKTISRLNLNNIIISKGQVDKKSLEVMLGKRKEVVMPLEKSSIHAIKDALGEYFNKRLWDKTVAQYKRAYRDLDIPSFDDAVKISQSILQKVIVKPAQKSGVLARRVYSRYRKLADRHDLRTLSEKLHLSQDTICQMLERFGILSEDFIEEELGNLEKIASNPVLGMKVYSGENKKRIRAQWVSMAQEYLKRRQVSYLGLEGNNFISYILFSKHLNIMPSKSLIPERNDQRSNVMESIVKYHDRISGGEIFEGLRIYAGEVVDALSDADGKVGPFNLVNLDYEGGWSSDKEDTVKMLFDKPLLADRALVLFTLSDGSLERTRISVSRGKNMSGYNTTDQYKIAFNLIHKYGAKNGFTAERFYIGKYIDTRIPMVSFGFKIRKEERSDDQHRISPLLSSF